MKTKNKDKNDIQHGNFEIDPDEFLPQHVKVRITTMVDLDILESLKKISENKKTKYQTLLNSILRSYLESQKAGPNDLESTVRKIVKQELRRLA